MPQFDSDLAAERRTAPSVPGLIFRKTKKGGIVRECVTVASPSAAKAIGRPEGRYETVGCDPLHTLAEDTADAVSEEIRRSLLRMIPAKRRRRILVVGLGNSSLTVDAVGPKVVEYVNSTLQIKQHSPDLFRDLGVSEVVCFAPGVPAKTGIDTAVSVHAFSQAVKPSAVLLVDALAARDTARLGRTVEIGTGGITPGGGVGGVSSAIDEKLLGVPAVGIGVPTVTSAATFAREAGGDPHLVPEGLFVCPSDIDELTEQAARVVADAINRAFGFEI